MVSQINGIPEQIRIRKELTLTQTTFDVQAMYPSLNADFLIKEISEICIGHTLRYTDAENRKERENTHEVTMRILIFLLEHNLKKKGKFGRERLPSCENHAPQSPCLPLHVKLLTIIQKM